MPDLGSAPDADSLSHPDIDPPKLHLGGAERGA
jgi:hypothetical protein